MIFLKLKTENVDALKKWFVVPDDCIYPDQGGFFPTYIHTKTVSLLGKVGKQQYTWNKI